jgi:hypothetical protein
MNRPTARFGRLLYDVDGRAGRYTSYTLYVLNVAFLLLYVVGTYDFSEPYRTQVTSSPP